MARNFKPKICKLCLKEFVPRNNCQRYCGSRADKESCSSRHLRQYSSAWVKEKRGSDEEFSESEKLHQSHYRRTRYKNNSEYRAMIKDRDTRRRAINPVPVSEINGRRRELMEHIQGSHTEKEWLQCKKAHQFSCAACGIAEGNLSSVYDCPKWHKLTRDHVVPVSSGGTDYIANIQPLCISCNCRKGISEGEAK